VIELHKKFMTGKSQFDDPEKELIFNEKIDFARRIRNLPTSEQY